MVGRANTSRTVGPRSRPGTVATAVPAAVLALVLAAVLTVTACTGQGGGGPRGDAAPVAAPSPRTSDGSGTSEATEAIRSAADVLVRTGSSRARTAMEMDSGGTRLTIRATGGFDYRAGVGELTVVLPDAGRLPVTEVIKPGLLYMKNRGAGVPADKWVRVDTSELSDGNLVTGGVTDPLSATELLRGAGGVSYVGSLDLDGVGVRHYRGTTDLVAAARRATAPMRAQLTAAAKGFSSTLVPFDAYLDSEGRPRKVRHEFVFDNSEGRGVRVDSTTVLYGFGTPVRVDMPRRADIYTGRIMASEADGQAVEPGRNGQRGHR
ncbi:hypothetical protein JGS22_011420 [Streptomyces sp. P38-E01]|uniref:Lipoprotein n=1 Tax=Streptomyces tardus TaxID=2780544 RepID=A0A949JDR7_9ACTN|nr:hypothetical protein [Streptomyces tardus]